MITEDYVSFEMTKLLKKKGFNELDCDFLGWIGKSGKHYSGNDTFYDDKELKEAQNDMKDNMPLISLQTAMKWLREVHEIIPIILTGGDSQNPFYYWFRIDMIIKGRLEDAIYAEHEKEFPTYEQACEAAIKYCLEKLI